MSEASRSCSYPPEFYEGKREGARRSAGIILPLVLSWIRPASAVDVGCGTGAWLAALAELGVEDLLGIDGEHVRVRDLEIPPERFLSHDLTNPLKLERTFDLVLSLEVAEHLPEPSAGTFVDSLVALGPAVLFSAAVPLQGGTHHVNEQWPGYWARLFRERGYGVIDCLREGLWKNQEIDSWYAQNLLLYVRETALPGYPALEELRRRTDPSRLARVHPRLNRKGFDGGTGSAPIRVERRIELEVTEPVADESCPGADAILVDVKLEGERLGSLRLPVIEQSVPGYVLEDAIAAEHGFTILGRFLARTLYPGEVAPLYDDVVWVSFLQELWDRPGWPLARFVDSRASDGRAAPVVKAPEGFRLELSEELPDLRSRARWLPIVLTAGGVAFGEIVVRVHGGKVRAPELRSAAISQIGGELWRVAVREALLGRSLHDGVPLRERLRQKAATAAARRAGQEFLSGLAPSVERFLGDRPYMALGHRSAGAFDTSAARRAVLPPEAAEDLIGAAESCGEPHFERMERDGPSTIVYAPEWIETASGASALWQRAARALRRRTLGRREARLEQSLSRVRNERILRAVELACWSPSYVTKVVTDRLLILCYHRVTPVRERATERYRVTPEQFEEQLRYFQHEGYYSAPLHLWRKAIARGKPLPGRALAITFDGGYRELLTHAWPLLQAYGFTATVFLAADMVGRDDVPDELYGERVSFASFRELGRLARAGMEFGSLTCTGRPLTALPLEELVREAARSRAILGRGLNCAVHALAYPHGHCDEIVARLAGASGFYFGLTCRPSPSTLNDSLLELPRLEVWGSESLPELLARVGL